MSEPTTSAAARTGEAPVRSKPTWIFAYVMGASLGGASGVVAGSFTVGWGMALAPLAVCAVFAFGLWREGDERLRHALRLVMAFTLAFLLVLVPTVLMELATPVGSALTQGHAERRAAMLRPILAESVARWSVMAASIPFAFYWIRRKRHMTSI